MNFSNPVQLHLLINHLAVVGLPLSVLVAIYLFRARPGTPFTLFYLLLLVCALGGMVAHQTGESAHQWLRGSWVGNEHDLMEAHEELAENAIVGSLVLLVVSLLGLVGEFLDFGWRKYLLALAIVLSLGMTIYLGAIAHSGGLIKHEKELGLKQANPSKPQLEEKEAD
jgi:hypothetical protein